MTVRIAQIGVGRWGMNLLRNIRKTSGAELFAVCDADVAKVKTLGDEFNARPYSDLDALLGDSEVDAVVIATPSGQHFAHVMAALRAGKHVFVEKPMADSAADALQMVSLAEEKCLTLMIGHTFLYNNVVSRIKDIIDSGDLGDIYYVYSQRLNLGQFRSDSDVLWTLAPHDVSILNYWMGSTPVSVSARGLTFAGRDPDHAEVCFANASYSGGRAANIHMSWLAPQKIRQMVVVGSRKMLLYDDTAPGHYIQIYDKGAELDYTRPTVDAFDFSLRIRSGDIVMPHIALKEPLGVEMQHFVDCIKTGRTPRTDGRHGLEVTRVLEEMSKSMRRGGAEISLQ